MTYFTDLGLTPLTGDITVEMVINGSVITMKLNGLDAPVTAANFVDLVERGIYNATKFHRLEPGFVVQGGDPQSKDPTVSEELFGTGGFIDPTTEEERNIPLEIKPVGADEPIYSQTFAEAEITAEPFLPHSKGAIAMARTNDPDTASSQFYFALDDLPQLDGSYAVFGEVTEGMSVVENIAKGDAIQYVAVTGGSVASRSSALVTDFELLNSFINDTNTTKIEYTLVMAKPPENEDDTSAVDDIQDEVDEDTSDDDMTDDDSLIIDDIEDEADTDVNNKLDNELDDEIDTDINNELDDIQDDEEFLDDETDEDLDNTEIASNTDDITGSNDDDNVIGDDADDDLDDDSSDQSNIDDAADDQLDDDDTANDDSSDQSNIDDTTSDDLDDDSSDQSTGDNVTDEDDLDDNTANDDSSDQSNIDDTADDQLDDDDNADDNSSDPSTGDNVADDQLDDDTPDEKEDDDNNDDNIDDDVQERVAVNFDDLPEADQQLLQLLQDDNAETDTDKDETVTRSASNLNTRTAAIMALGGDDQIQGTNGNDVINGNQGDDEILGADGHDFLRGGKGNDNLSGGLGNDFLVGDYGVDTLTGNEGRDTFILRSQTSAGVTTLDLADIITDFSVTDGDRISVIADFVTEADLVYETSGSDTILKLGTTGDILALVKGATQSMIEQNISIIGTDDIALTRIG